MSIRKLCPKNYAWYIADCDFGQNCENCELEDAPINDKELPNRAKDAIHDLIKIYTEGSVRETKLRREG